MYNKLTIMGRLVADPELKSSSADLPVTNFSIACDRNYTDKNGKRETDFFNIVAWRHTATFICNNFQKGNLILLDGSLQTRSYNDKEGNKRTAYEMIVENAYFTGERKKSADNTSESYSENDITGYEPPPETHGNIGGN